MTNFTDTLKTGLISSMIVLSTSAFADSSIANPASERCVQLGGVLTTMVTSDGGEFGSCELGHALIEEWTLFRIAEKISPTSQVAVEYFKTAPTDPYDGTFSPASRSCQKRGGQTLSTKIKGKADSGESGYCLFADGSMIEEWTLFRGAAEEINSQLTKIMTGK